MRVLMYQLFMCCGAFLPFSLQAAQEKPGAFPVASTVTGATLAPADKVKSDVKATPEVKAAEPAQATPASTERAEAPSATVVAEIASSATIESPTAEKEAEATTEPKVAAKEPNASDKSVFKESKRVADKSSKTKPSSASAAATDKLTDDEIVSIDNADIDEPQGNWLFKRLWWQRSEAQYEKIKGVVDTIMESRLAFFTKRTEWDKTIFDPFYVDVGVGRGVLEELISNSVAQMNEERQAVGELDKEERDLLTALQAEKASLEQLQKDIQQISAIDSAVDEAISALINQINAARNFEKQSWQNLKMVAQELSDKKARELYYGMATYWQNINDIAAYIQGPFAKYFEDLGSAAREQTAKVTTTLNALKEKGIDFKKTWQNLEEKNRQERDAKEYGRGKEAAEKKVVVKEVKVEKQPGFFEQITSSVSNFFSSLWNGTLGRLFKKSETIVPVKYGESTATPSAQTEAE